MHALSIMTYNICHGSGMDGRWDISRPVAVARKFNPDVLCLQEVDRGTARSFGSDEPAMVAHMLDPLRHWAFVKSLDYQGGEYGNAVLSREEPISTVRCPLPGVNEQRSVIACEFAHFVVATLHASLHDTTRLDSVRTIARLPLAFCKPFFITGDWNAGPDSPFLDAMRGAFTILSDTSLQTCPADMPRNCIDYVAVDNAHADRVRVIETITADEPLASDHRPVIVRVEVTGDQWRVTSDQRPVTSDLCGS